MIATGTALTAEDLLGMPDDGHRYELVKGELRRMAPAGIEHGVTGQRLSVRLGSFVDAHGLGVTVMSESGFKIASDPDTVRAPDCAFIRKERIPDGPLPRGYWPGAPDLAVEVVSPGDTYSEVEEKALAWLDAGTRMVIVPNPRNRTVTVYRSRREVVVLTDADDLSGGDVVPGFTCRVAELFEPPVRG